MGSLKTVEDSQNKENINDSGGFIVLLKQFAFFPSLGINKSFWILNKEKSFCYVINPSLTKLFPSRLLDISLDLFFCSYKP